MLKVEVDGVTKSYHDIDDPFFIETFPKIKDHTITAMGGAEPTWALYKSIEYIVKNDIPGDIRRMWCLERWIHPPRCDGADPLRRYIEKALPLRHLQRDAASG